MKDPYTIAEYPGFEENGFEYPKYIYAQGDRPNCEYNQNNTIDGVIINPGLPVHFDNYPNERRSSQEIEDWWDRPFIIAIPVVHQKTKSVSCVYMVRCLDGGAWDRSTNWGEVEDLEDALEIAKNGPRWRRG